MPARVTKPKVSSIAAMSDEFLEQRFKIRGVEYLIREVDITDYDKIVAAATATKLNAEGEEEEIIDNTMVVRMLVEKSVIEPRNLPKGTRALRALQTEVSNLHFGLEPIERPDKDGGYPSDKVDDGLDHDEDEDDDPNASAG